MGEHRVGTIGELTEAVPRRVLLDGVAVCLVRLGDRVHAIGDTCTHQDVSLSEGEVDPDECTVECWKHGSAFSLETGAPLSLPATRPVPVYDVRVDGDEVVVDVSAVTSELAGGGGAS